MIRFLFMMNKAGTTRIHKFWGTPLTTEEKRKLEREVFQTMVARDKSLANMCEIRDWSIVYHRYVGLYVVVGLDAGDSELLAHETIHLLVEILDAFFGTVREIDIIYHFTSVYAILDEFILAGFLQETNKDAILDRIRQMPQLGAK